MCQERAYKRGGATATAGAHFLLSLTAIGGSKGLSLLGFLLLGSLQRTYTLVRSPGAAGCRRSSKGAHHLDTTTRKGTLFLVSWTFQSWRLGLANLFRRRSSVPVGGAASHSPPSSGREEETTHHRQEHGFHTAKLRDEHHVLPFPVFTAFVYPCTHLWSLRY